MRQVVVFAAQHGPQRHRVAAGMRPSHRPPPTP